MMREIFTINPFPLMILARLAILITFSGAFFWLYSVLRLHFSKFEIFNLKVTVKNSFIESLLIAIVLFAGYFFLFLTLNGWQYFVWNEWRWTLTGNIYFMLLPEIILFTLLNIFFFIRLNNLLQTTKNK